MAHVKKMRELFAGKAPPKTPLQFEMERRAAIRKEFKEIQIARQRAAAYNMTLRALAIQAGKRAQTHEDSDRKARSQARKAAQQFRMTNAALPLKKNSPEEKDARARHSVLSNIVVSVVNGEAEPTADDQLSTIAESVRNSMGSAALPSKDQVQQEAENLLNRQALVSFLQENYPDRLNDVDVLLSQFKGREDMLFQELTEQLNKELAERLAREKEEALANDEPAPEEDPAPEVERLEEARRLSVMRQDDQQAPRESLAKRASKKILSTISRKSSDGATEETPSVPGQALFDEGVKLHQVVHSFYSIYAPEKLEDIDSVLKHFEGREQDLFSTLSIKYDVTFSKDGSAKPNHLDLENLPPSPRSSTATSKSQESDSAAPAEPVASADEERDVMEKRLSTPFVEAAPVVSSKFAVDVQSRLLGERLRAQGASPAKVKALMDTSGPMM